MNDRIKLDPAELVALRSLSEGDANARIEDTPEYLAVYKKMDKRGLCLVHECFPLPPSICLTDMGRRALLQRGGKGPALEMTGNR